MGGVAAGSGSRRLKIKKEQSGSRHSKIKKQHLLWPEEASTRREPRPATTASATRCTGAALTTSLKADSEQLAPDQTAVHVQPAVVARPAVGARRAAVG